MEKIQERSSEELLKALLEVQYELKAPKSKVNGFSKFRYRSAEDILEALKPLLHKHGLLLLINDEIVVIGEGNPQVQTVTEVYKDKNDNNVFRDVTRPIGGARFYVKSTVTLTNGISQLFSIGYAREEETKRGSDASQITGSSSSYARKYALNGLFLIDDTKDADTQDNRQPTVREEKKTTGKTPTIQLPNELKKPKIDEVLNAQIWAKIMSSKDLDELAIQARRILENEKLLSAEMIDKLTKAGTKKKEELQGSTTKVT